MCVCVCVDGVCVCVWVCVVLTHEIKDFLRSVSFV